MWNGATPSMCIWTLSTLCWSYYTSSSCSSSTVSLHSFNTHFSSRLKISAWAGCLSYNIRLWMHALLPGGGSNSIWSGHHALLKFGHALRVGGAYSLFPINHRDTNQSGASCIQKLVDSTFYQLCYSIQHHCSSWFLVSQSVNLHHPHLAWGNVMVHVTVWSDPKFLFMAQ